MAIERSDSDSILMIMCLASAGGTITPTGIRIMVSYLDQTGLEHTLEKLRNQMYPVGSLYFSTNRTSPATIYGGTWERYGKGRTLVSVDESDTDFTAGKTGGEKTHVLTMDEMPSHRHALGKYATMQGGGSWNTNKIGSAQLNDATVNDGYTKYTGSNKAHNNMPPYIAIYLWRRTA